jgi:hypothetical protein
MRAGIWVKKTHLVFCDGGAHLSMREPKKFLVKNIAA